MSGKGSAVGNAEDKRALTPDLSELIIIDLLISALIWSYKDLTVVADIVILLKDSASF